MMLTYFYMISILNFSYTNDITLGAPDTIKILVNPIKVAEKNDTIYVIDQEGLSKVIKKYTLDGFFIKAQVYNQELDSMIFTQSPTKPTTEIIKEAEKLKSSLYLENANWWAMHVEPDSLIWLVCDCWAGDAGWIAILAFIEKDSVPKVEGYGPGSGDFDITSLKFPREFVSFFYVGAHYIYLILDEMLWQYDRQARFVRNIGIIPNQCFKEPCGLAIDEHGSLFITDFRLGKIWEFRTGVGKLNLTCLPVSDAILPETPTFLAYSLSTGLWVTDAKFRTVKNINNREILRIFPLKFMNYFPGGTDYKLAAVDSLVVFYYAGNVFVYDIFGIPLKRFAGTDYEGKKDGIIGLDNCGNFYLFKRGEEWSDMSFFRINPMGTDTSIVVLPDSFQPYRMSWQKFYRIGDTLYVFGNNQIYPPQGATNFRGFYIFINDTLKHMISELEFEGGLPKTITDFVVDSYGLIWITDFDNRLVKRYRLLP